MRANCAFLFLLGCTGFATPALDASPDLTGKRYRIEWRVEGALQRTVEIAFVQGVPGRPVSATLLNPTPTEIEKYPDLAFKGTYSKSGKLEMRLMNPEKKQMALDMVLDVSGDYGVSGTWATRVGPSFGVAGDAKGKCLNPEKSKNWSKTAIFTALALFLLWALLSQTPPSPAPAPVKGKGGVDDPTDPWNDLKKK